MEKANFTGERVASFRCEPGKQQSIFWDAKTPGLGLRVTAGGARAYVFESRLFGKTLRIRIGDPRAWDLSKARTEAQRLKTLVDDGKDPREVKAEQRAAEQAKRDAVREAAESERARTTLLARTAWDDYLAAPHPKWSDRHRLDHVNAAARGGKARKRSKELTVAGPLASLLDQPLASIDEHVVLDWLKTETAARETVTVNAFRKFRTFVRWCAKSKKYGPFVHADCFRAQEVVDALPVQRPKDDCLQREQLSAWFDAVRKIDNPVIGTYLQGLLITGARREELAGLCWDDVDFRWRSLHIADKVETETGRTIPLRPYLASLLLELKRINDTPPNTRQLRRLEQRGEEWKPSPWVFASRTAADGKLAEPRIAHTNALEVAGLPHVSLHGLRRSFGTLAEWCEVPVGVVAQIQGHAPSAIAEKHYRRRPLDLLRMWHDKIEAWMLDQAGIAFDPADAAKGLHVK